ncbi:hypothetical protein KIN20_027589 [Parelaphostrongylus tenuis]|uniref:Uncharacterized protein n=1 Tax=Parelaphostrongylus tenuis TaxID=148309 RepID=A0AAD5QZJ2_PARTN|nr:hypothetical protein KIN20_027589 [Parelaphostrongylus tenuis]
MWRYETRGATQLGTTEAMGYSDAQTAIAKLNGLEVEENRPECQTCSGREKRKLLTNPPPMKPKTARESVTKFAGMSYNEQLTQKQRASHRLCERLLNEMGKANVTGVSRLRPSGIVKKIRPSPKIRKYRNKCEFTIGRTQEGTDLVGGRFSQNEHHIIPIDDLGQHHGFNEENCWSRYEICPGLRFTSVRRICAFWGVEDVDNSRIRS